MKFRLSPLNLAVVSCCLGFTAIPTMALAQNVQSIEVTGSRLKRADIESSAPLQVITRSDIEATGKLTIAEVLQALPGNNNGSVPTSFGNGFAAGGSGISLRGLSVNSTLVLVNGRRMAPYGLADDGQRNFVDLSSIPLDLVDRVEVLKDGASAVYGSDAIAGVVNIILRKDFNGFIGSASAGSSQYGDSSSTRASLTKGFGKLNEDGYNGFINFEASHQDALNMNDRAGQRDFIGLSNPFNDNSLTKVRGYAASATSVSASPTGWSRAVTAPYGVTAVSGSKYLQLGSGCVSNPSNATLTPYNTLPACLWNIMDYTMIQPKEDKVNLFARGTLNVSADMQVYGEAGLFNSKVSTIYTPTSVSGIWANPSTNKVMDNTYITMGPNHPDNPTPGSNARLRYVTADLGGRNSNYDTTVARILGGVKGVSNGWDYDAGYLYTQSETKIERNGYVVNSALKALLNGTTYNGVDYGSYYRLGTNAGLNTAAVRAAISPTLNNQTKNSVTAIDFKASRDLMPLPGGNLGLALGAEYRQEKLSSPPTPYTDVGDIVGLGYSAFNQSRNVTAAYAELNAPVSKALELNAAIRSDQYSDWGNATTPKLGAKLKVSDPLMLRASYAEGYRAPGAGESGKSRVSAYTYVADPVRCPSGTVPLPGALTADCNNQIVAFSSGNPNIKPEKSKSWNLGMVLEASKDLNVSVDLWQIVRTNEILGVDPQSVLNNPAGYPAAEIIRDASTALPGIANSGSLLAVLAPYENGPKTKANGVDIDMRYRFPVTESGIKFSGRMDLTFINTFSRLSPDGTLYNYAGTYGPTALSSSAGMPKSRAVIDLTGQKGDLSITGRVNYTSGIKQIESLEDTGCLSHFANGDNFYAKCRAPAFATMDLFGRYQYDKSLELTGSVQNLFNRVAAFDSVASYGATGYNPSYALTGVIGRYFRVGAKYKFN
jgi:iron complex outermembrane receptor protein